MKLRKLILSGFKSFADKTELEFDDGISCIVGPNGCGKSNVVDAVKWVLGERSAKSLRATEMTDVIFNGSSTRRPAGGAEVTLVFDNSSGMLRPQCTGENASMDTIAVTRRLFRSGQSEYLINKTPCRLRDILEMFMDTGNAYSLIEQGRVEGFLQASQEERRAIFDEAAGISKYKARKKESLRKLERVDQNLLRVNDIFEEVQKRLRSIKYQAGKARNYQTYSQRLKELRSLYFLAQYHRVSAQRSTLQGRLDASCDSMAQLTARIERLEAARSAAEVETVDIERTARQVQTRTADIGARITTSQQRAEMLEVRSKELTDQILLTCSRCEELEAKVESLDEQLEQRRSEASEIENSVGETASRCESVHQGHRAAEQQILYSERELEDEKTGTIDLLRRTAQLHNEIHGLGVRRQTLNGRRDHLTNRAKQIDESLTDVLTRRAETEAKLREVEAVLSDARERLDNSRTSMQNVRERQSDLQHRLREAREQRSALRSRITALQEMQRKLEGVGAGVRRVLEARRDGKLQVVRGMLGDFIRADVDRAAVVEAALAAADQLLLVEKLRDIETNRDELTEVLGSDTTVELLPLDRLGPFVQDFIAADLPQVLARVIDWVEFDAWLGPLMWRLLGRTLIVETLRDAIIASKTAPSGTRFVTLAGEVLEGDGCVRIGAAARTAGVITRRSELSDLERKVELLTEQIAELQNQCSSAQDQLTRIDQLQQKLRTVIYEANTERVESVTSLGQLNEQIEKLEREKPLIAADLEHLAAEIDAAVRTEHTATQNASELERLNVEREHKVEQMQQHLSAARRAQENLTEKLTELKVALVRAEEKKHSIQQTLTALTAQREQMGHDLAAGREEMNVTRQRRTDAETGARAAREQVETLYAEQQQLNLDAADLEQSRNSLTERLEKIRAELTEQRKAHQATGSEVNTFRVELGETDVRIENIITRASDEMGMNLLELYRNYSHDEQRDWDAVETEIKDLKGKVERLGNVNLDAIPEQEQLEQRRDFLSAQLADIRSSQTKLNELIKRINNESRELFVATFQEVRGHFQQLFRKLFGGGRADIYLSDPEDVLESGIEIVARPPGKELRTLSLLSGGEKTMTALAMLFSIFKSKPSPFCLLDEVDAALDETNTERFSKLLQEFNENSQFIIISHAKRTMSMAGVLYGVTMQEPGVSKRISVRFEDVDRTLGKQLEEARA